MVTEKPTSGSAEVPVEDGDDFSSDDEDMLRQADTVYAECLSDKSSCEVAGPSGAREEPSSNEHPKSDITDKADTIGTKQLEEDDASSSEGKRKRGVVSKEKGKEVEAPTKRRRTDMTFATFDLETTGFNEACDILQLGVRVFTFDFNEEASEEFNQYVYPKNEIPREASAVNHLYIENGKLVKRKPSGDQQLQTEPIKVALPKMWEWLIQESSEVILIGWNNYNFDNAILGNSTKENCESELISRIRSTVKFADIRDIMNLRGMSGKLEEVYRSTGGPPLEFHDAIADSRAVCYIIRSKGITEDRVKNNADPIARYL